MKAEYAVSNRMVGYSESFELTLSCQPGFDHIGLHVATWIERIREQGPSHGSISTSHSAKFIRSADKFIRLLRIYTKCHRDQYRAVLRVWLNDNLWTCAVQSA